MTKIGQFQPYQSSIQRLQAYHTAPSDQVPSEGYQILNTCVSIKSLGDINQTSLGNGLLYTGHFSQHSYCILSTENTIELTFTFNHPTNFFHFFSYLLFSRWCKIVITSAETLYPTESKTREKQNNNNNKTGFRPVSQMVVCGLTF